ncbi:hypothetical protein JHK87_031922 [Glycine soja]|nr:hypothetical protein JHK87_031922 [Glycine soja]
MGQSKGKKRAWHKVGKIHGTKAEQLKVISLGDHFEIGNCNLLTAMGMVKNGNNSGFFPLWEVHAATLHRQHALRVKPELGRILLLQQPHRGGVHLERRRHLRSPPVR